MIIAAARPRDVFVMMAAVRNDILVNDGSMVEMPGSVDFHFNSCVISENACMRMAGRITLAWVSRFKEYTLRRAIFQRVEAIHIVTWKCAFKWRHFTSFQRLVTDGQIESICKRAGQARRRH